MSTASMPAATRAAIRPLRWDVSGVWRPGENTVEVRAQDDRLSWQPYGKQGYGDIQGIWQSVWLEARPEAYLEDFRFLPHRDGAWS